MKKVKVKIPAKVNLSLDVGKVKDGFHPINSLVCSVDIYDEITVKRRTDDKIIIKEKGIPCRCEEKDNNAYKSAKLFTDTYSCTGAEITLNKNIPVGAGLGGSSADIAGTLIAMEKLYGKGADLVALANSLGSDSGYMVNGGLAVLSGRGDKIEKLNIPLKLYLLIITNDKGVSTKECYKLFDEGVPKKPCTDDAVDALKKRNYDKFCFALKNDLLFPSVKLLPEIQSTLCALTDAGAKVSLLTGSGSAVYGIFDEKKDRDSAYKKLLQTYGGRLIKAQTL